MGTPEFAVPALKELLKEKLNITHVYTQPPKKSNRGLKIEKTPVHLEAEKNNCYGGCENSKSTVATESK